MNRIISTSVTPEQYGIIKQMADANNMTISQFMKESVQVTTALSYISDTLAKLKWEDITQDAMDRNAKIMEHAQEMVKLMQPHFEKALSAIPKDVMKALKDDGRELSNTMKVYNKPVKRGRPPSLATKRGKRN